MNRRNFVAGIVGLFASVKVLASSRAVSLGEEGYTYDWNANPQWTDDPRFSGGLLHGGRDVHATYLDGRDVSDLLTFKLKTGPNGYVEYFILNTEGKYYEEIEGELAKRKEYGTVRYLPVGGFPQPLIETTTAQNKNYRTFFLPEKPKE